MKHLFSTSILATSLLTIAQLASAMDAMTLCPSLSKFQDTPFDNVSKAYETNRYNLTTTSQRDENKTAGYSYMEYTLTIQGVKGKSAADAIDKAQTALANAISANPVATRIEPNSYAVNCYYTLDFSGFGDEYNNMFPTAVVQIYGTATQGLFSLPALLSFKK